MADLVEQDYSCATNLTRGAQHTEAWTEDSEPDNQERDIAESTSAATEITPQDSSDIPAWVLAESEEFSREVTPPTECFFWIKGNDKMATAARRLSSGLYTIYTARRDSNAQHWSRS